ncbi:EamA family transporter [Phenylobacterium montanum]|uniref:EamA family transporter n=2 Tax=Phenylobacterium montanum TaxID=2823693 RepID=A0A975G5B0_9CAUL|nr:EamA family transporter [Caulobacter sp. S6]
MTQATLERAPGRSAGLAGSILLLLAAMATVQIGASLAKQMFALVGPLGAAALRLVFASLILVLVARPWRGELGPAERRAVLAYGVVLGIMNPIFYSALQRLPLGLAVAIEFTGPLGLALVTSHRRLDLAWVALAVAGVCLILLLKQVKGAVDPIGVALALAAGACWAAYIWFGQKLSVLLPSARATALGSCVAALVAVPVGAASAGVRLLNPAVLPVALAVAVLSSVLPYSLEMMAMKRVPTRTFGVLMSLEPAFAALSGLALLGERLTVTQWLGMGCVMAASLGAAMTARGGGGGHAG